MSRPQPGAAALHVLVVKPSPAILPRKTPVDPGSFLRAGETHSPPACHFHSDSQTRPGRRPRRLPYVASLGAAPPLIACHDIAPRAHTPVAPRLHPCAHATTSPDQSAGLPAK